jgi:excisionase family DNA binding protein
MIAKKNQTAHQPEKPQYPASTVQQFNKPKISIIEPMNVNSQIATASTGKLLFNVNEAAARLSVSVVSIRKLIRQNRLRRVPNFRKILISDAELHKFAAIAE